MKKDKDIHTRISSGMYDDLQEMCEEFEMTTSGIVRKCIGYTIENWKEERGGSITLDVLDKDTDMFHLVCEEIGIEQTDFIPYVLTMLGNVIRDKDDEKE